MSQDENQASAVTLGGVLYADAARKPVSEEECALLVRAIAEGDRVALLALYQRTRRIVFTLVLRITTSQEAAEQLTVDVFHDVWLRAAEYDADQGTVLAWLMNLSRARAVDRQPGANGTGKRQTSNGTIDVAAPAVAQDVRNAALDVLLPDERRTMEAVLFSGLTQAEAARHLGQPLDTVQARIRSALHRMRFALAAQEKQ